ncbi:MAG: c-type cytochrome [Chloroherpetonaceae bacterium]
MNQTPEFFDSSDKRSMDEIHAAAFREAKLPEEGVEPGPVWLYVIIFSTLCFGFFYIGRYLGEISDRPHVLEEGAILVSNQPEPPQPLFKVGEKVYRQRCVSCHQENGQGVEGAYPPLVQSNWVTGNPDRLVSILLYGINGNLTVNGKVYNGNMPAWETLTDEQIAGVATYIRNSWGNSADTVQIATVADGRKKITRAAPWTEQELNDVFKPQLASGAKK